MEQRALASTAELSTFQRFQALEPRARLNGVKLDCAATQQNGFDCWFVATLSMLRRKNFRLPKDFNVQGLRAKSCDWLLARAE